MIGVFDIIVYINFVSLIFHTIQYRNTYMEPTDCVKCVLIVIIIIALMFLFRIKVENFTEQSGQPTPHGQPVPYLNSEWLADSPPPRATFSAFGFKPSELLFGKSDAETKKDELAQQYANNRDAIENYVVHVNSKLEPILNLPSGKKPINTTTETRQDSTFGTNVTLPVYTANSAHLDLIMALNISGTNVVAQSVPNTDESSPGRIDVYYDFGPKKYINSIWVHRSY